MKDLQLYSAFAGVASPIVLAATTIVVAQQRPEYSHIRNTLSELGMVGAPNATWMNLAGIIPAGILVTLAAGAVHRAFGIGRFSKAGAVFLGFGGLSLAASALSPWRGAPMDFTTLTNVLHAILAMVGFASISIAPLLLSLHARRSATIQEWCVPSLVAAAGIATLAFWPSEERYLGVFQRAALGVFYLWLSSACIWAAKKRFRTHRSSHFLRRGDSTSCPNP